ncbi:ascorbate transporter, chloroplastic-like [Silene latifolia]|uniref:ascorbate transporter, chloroplastic-like n=1 Tax=Silene latifolia TaxID=37657 RepID=UPI003D77B12B
MAIGGVISNRTFGSFLSPGTVCHRRNGVSSLKKEEFGLSIGLWGQRVPNKISHQLTKNCLTFQCSYCSLVCITKAVDWRSSRHSAAAHDRSESSYCPTSLTRVKGSSICSVYPNSYGRRKDHRGRGILVNYKSEEIDVTEAALESFGPSEGESEVVLGDNNAQKETSFLEPSLPKRWLIVLLCFAAFLLCNMDRVNMSIAILPMSKEFNWSSSTVGLIQSSFFWGYLLTQIVGGIWADKVGGKLVLGFGVIWWSVATILTPFAARISLPCLLVVRAFMGIGEGVAMPAMNNMISKWIPVSERSRALSLVYSGMYLGSVVGLGFSPILIHKLGWPSVFYSFGSLGTIWIALWLANACSSPAEDPDLSAQEKRFIMEGSTSKEPVTVIPWKLILSKAPVWALIISHFCHNWGTFILLTWMPTYYNQVLKFNLMESGLFCVLPWLTMAIFANIGGWIADTLISRGLSVTSVRKIMQTIGFLGPALSLSVLSKVKTPALAVLCMACSQGADAFSQSGLYSNHQDIGPRYSGVLLGLSNTAGVLAGVFGTAATGFILQRGSWDDVFKVAIVLYIVGTIVWNTFATGERILD